MKNENFQLDISQHKICVVIPAYKVEREIEAVLSSLPKYISNVIVVNDASPDRTAEIVQNTARKDKRIILLNHERNQGVGGAMITGYKKALELDVDVVVKLDGDGQMSADNILALVIVLIKGDADYAKGNRFRDFQSLGEMPIIRRIGNVGLSFLAKAATGYWNCFDPTNGFIAIRRDILGLLPLKKIHKTYFFETSMLSQLYLMNAFIMEIPMPARYRGEKSNLSVLRVLSEFPIKLLYIFVRRIFLKNFVYDFSMLSVYILIGLPLFLFAGVFGSIEWLRYANIGVGAPTGTIVLALLGIILGFELILSAIALDLQSIPHKPLYKDVIVNSVEQNDLECSQRYY